MLPRLLFLLLPLALGACATDPGSFPNIPSKPKSTGDEYLSMRTSYYEQKNKNLSEDEARARAQSDYNLFSDPVTGEVP